MKVTKILLVLGCIVCVGIGVLADYWSGQLAMLGKRAKGTPQSLTLGDFVKKGAGDNQHVTLNQFDFGQPIIESKDGKWSGVWLPLRDRGQPTFAVLWAPRIRTQVQLEDFLKRRTADVLIAKGFV